MPSATGFGFAKTGKTFLNSVRVAILFRRRRIK
jgi:hypothetical protein